jgi:hypothetical protein
MTKRKGGNQKIILNYLEEIRKRGEEYGASLYEITLFVYECPYGVAPTHSQKTSVRKSINLLGDEYLDAIKFPYTGARRHWYLTNNGIRIMWARTERYNMPNYEKFVRLKKRPLKGPWKKWRTKC